jgi:hypothetical protein
MKKRLLALLLLCTLFLTVIACSSPDGDTKETQDTAADTTVAVDEPEELSDNLPNADFDGYEFNIFSCIFFDRELGEYVTFEELTGDPVDDVLYNSKITIEDRFNCKIAIIRAGSDTGAHMSQVKASVKAGDHAFDMSIGHDNETVNASMEGNFYNLFNVPQFDFSKPWWPENTVENLSLLGKMYVGSNYMSYCGLHWTRALLVNKTEAENMGIEIPYEQVKAGTWYLDDMITMVQDAAYDVNGNGKMDNGDFFGFATGDQTWYCMQESAGIQIVTKDPALGGLALAVDQDKVMNYLDKIRYLIKDSGSFYQEGAFAVETFRKGNTLIAYTQVGDAYDTFRASEISYGFLPAPKLDENQEDYISTCTDVPWAIPITSEPYIDKVGTIIEAMSAYNYKYVIPAYFEVALMKKLADAPEDAEMLDIIKTTRTIGFAYAFSLPFRNLVADCVQGNSEFSSYYAKQEKSAIKTLDKIYNKYDELY